MHLNILYIWTFELRNNHEIRQYIIQLIVIYCWFQCCSALFFLQRDPTIDFSYMVLDVRSVQIMNLHTFTSVRMFKQPTWSPLKHCDGFTSLKVYTIQYSSRWQTLSACYISSIGRISQQKLHKNWRFILSLT